MSRCALEDSMVAQFGKTTTEENVKKSLRWAEAWDNAAAVAGTTAIAEAVAARVKQKSRLVGAIFSPNAAVTGAATNFFNILIDKRPTSAPGTPVNLITYAADTVTTDDAAAFGSKDLYVAAYIAGGAAAGADFDFEEGDVATVEVTKSGGSGMSFPAGRVTLIFAPRD